MAVTIPQGSDATLHVTGILDAADAPLDPSGMTVVAQLRVRPGAPLLAEWVTDPGEDQGRASTDTAGVHLEVPAAMSEGWSWTVARLHVEVYGSGTEARVGDVTVYLDPAIIPA